MSPLDLIALAILAYNTLRGLASGLVRTAFGLAAVSVASLLSWKHPEWGRPLVAPFVEPGTLWWGILQPLAVWAGAFLAINAIGIVLRMLLDKTPLRVVDRIGGAVFGLASGLVLISLPLLLVAKLPLLQEVKPLQEALAKSEVASRLAPLVAALEPGISSQEGALVKLRAARKHVPPQGRDATGGSQ